MRAAEAAAVHDAFVAGAWFGLVALTIAVFMMPRSRASTASVEQQEDPKRVRALSG
jgi:hypothetical protein